MAPWARLRSLLATTRSGSTSSLVPSPVHVGQAPCGVLNEKLLGSRGVSDVPSYGQARFSEYNVSFHSEEVVVEVPLPLAEDSPTPERCRSGSTGSLMITCPEPSFSACSIESAMRDLS